MVVHSFMILYSLSDIIPRFVIWLNKERASIWSAYLSNGIQAHWSTIVFYLSERRQCLDQLVMITTSFLQIIPKIFGSRK
jgi:hypothetical protein